MLTVSKGREQAQLLSNSQEFIVFIRLSMFTGSFALNYHWPHSVRRSLDFGSNLTQLCLLFGKLASCAICTHAERVNMLIFSAFALKYLLGQSATSVI